MGWLAQFLIALVGNSLARVLTGAGLGRDRAEEEIWPYPKGLYSRYRSATLHTASHKFKVPKRVLQGLSVCVTVIIFLWLGWLYLSKPPAAKDMKVEQGAGASPATSALAPLGAGLPEARPFTHDEYIIKHTPRIEFQPWSAPVFDDRTVQSQPELYCMASGTTDKDTTCTCLTEQGTKAKVRLPVCVAIARDGPAYNPYKQPGQVGPDSGRQISGGSETLDRSALATSAGAPSPHLLLNVQNRPVGTFPESVQNRYGGN